MKHQTLEEYPPFPEALKVHAVYRDGSGRAEETHNWELDNLLKTQAVLNALEAFIFKYQERLAGLSWDFDAYFAHLNGAPIYLNCVMYRGQQIDARGVADLFPEVLEWERVKPRHGIDEETTRDWMGELDGVRIHIRGAEFYRKVPTSPPWAGKGKVALRRK